MEENETCVFVTQQGMCLRIPIRDIPQQKKTAVGVRGIKLNAGDLVEAFYYPDQENEKVIIYKEKEVHLDRLKIGNRDTKGTKIRV